MAFRFARGFKRTELGLKTKVEPIGHLLAQVLNTNLTNGDMSPFRDAQVRQKNQGECTGAGYRRAGQLWFAVRNIMAASLSDQGFYTLGRLQDYAGMNPDNVPPLADTGADPVLVAQAANKVGLLLARDWPGPGDPGHIVVNRNVEPPSDLLLGAYERRGLRAYEVTWAPGQLQSVAYTLLRSGVPLMAAFCADGIAVTDPKSGIVSNLPPKSRADHWVTLLDSGMRPEASPLSFGLWDNWWDNADDPDPDLRIEWGDRSLDPRYDGTWRLDWRAADAGLALVLALDFVPAIGGQS